MQPGGGGPKPAVKQAAGGKPAGGAKPGAKPAAGAKPGAPGGAQRKVSQAAPKAGAAKVGLVFR